MVVALLEVHMEHVEYTYTFGMTDGELDQLIRTHGIGVLSLADAGDAYAVPVAYDYDGESLVVRLADHEDSTKMTYLDGTDTATFVIYEPGDSSWSILVRGELRERDDFDETRINQRFSTLRVFDEPIDEVEVVVYELEMTEVTGRRAE